MADLAVSLQLTASDDASAAIAKVRDALDEVGNAASETGKKADETRSAFDRIKEGMEEGFGLALGYTGFRDLRDVIESTIDTVVGFNAELETMATRLENLTGSVGATTEALQAVRDQADASPFEFKDIEAGEERLLRFNFSIDQSSQLLKVAADAAAGGAGSVDLITEAFGRMNTKEELTSRGLMSLTAAGIPVFDMLAQGLNVSTAQAEDLVKKGLIPAKEGIDILSAAIEAKFPDMAAKVATGFDATVKNLKETIQFATAEMGKPLFDVLESAIRDALAFLKSPDVQGALDDFSTNVAATVRTVVDWFGQLGSAMSQPDVQANLHEAWDALLSVGNSLWGLVKDFTIDLASFNKTAGVSTGEATTMAEQVKLLSGELRDISGVVRDTASGFKDFGDGLNMFKSASDDLATAVHNDLITALQDALTPIQQLVDMLNEFSTLADKTFHIKIDIPGQAGLQQFLDSIHGVQTVSTSGPTASSAGGPSGIPNVAAMNAGGGLEGAGPIIPADVGGRAAFQASFAPYAAYAAQQLGIAPSLVTAMAISESGGGNLPGNSFFGMKGSPLANGSTTQATWELENGQRVNQNAGFATFADARTSMDAWVQYIQQHDPSAIGATTPESFAQGLKSGGYMTDTAAHYAATLRALGAVDGSGGASGGVEYGPNPVSGQAGFIGPAPVSSTASTADMAAKVAEPLTDTFAKLMRDSGTKLAGIQTTEDRSLASAASQFGAGGTADQAAESDAAKKSAALDSNKAIQEDAARRKAAVAQEVQDDTDRENQRLASEAVVYNRGFQDQATAHSRKLEDDQILVNQQLANVALVHQRDLQDAQTVHQQTLALAATKHQQDLQDAQTLVNQQIANVQLLHQRQLQDAQTPLTEQLQAQATAHARTLEDTEVQYQYDRSLSKAKTDAERAQITTAHQDNLENIAHQRELQNAEIVYQQGLAAAALAKQRADQDAEIKYQDDQKAQQVAAQRVVAATESQYQMGLAAEETKYQRGLQDAEVVYQQGIAAQALVRSRALADQETAYNRGLEDQAAVHTAELQATARAFAATEKAKTDAVDKQLADEAFAREKQQVVDELAAKKASIAEEYAAKVAAAIETARIARETLKTATDQGAQDQIDAATKALAGFNGAGDPIIAKMKADWAAFDSDLATASNDVVGNQTAIQTAQAATAASATAATATIAAATTGASADYAQSAVDISASLGITDLAVETFADTHHTTWDDARTDLNNAATHARDVLGEGGTIPTAADTTTTAFDEVRKAAANTSALDQLKTAAQELAQQGLDPATKAAQDLQKAIQDIQDKTITVTTVFNGSPIGSQQEANAASSGGSGISEGTNRNNPGTSGGFDISSQAGRQAARDQLGSGFVVTDQGIRNNATGALVQGFAQGGIVPGASGEPILIMAHGGETVTPQGGSTSIDYDKLAEAMVRAMNKNGSFAVGVDQIHTALLQKARRSGSLQLT